jgi:XrtJ-associated TM-motif-TM protein
MRKAFLAIGFSLILATALPLRAQTGCDDSPEDPTVVLALVGGAGALIAGLRSRRKQPERTVTHYSASVRGFGGHR